MESALSSDEEVKYKTGRHPNAVLHERLIKRAKEHNRRVIRRQGCCVDIGR